MIKARKHRKMGKIRIRNAQQPLFLLFSRILLVGYLFPQGHGHKSTINTPVFNYSSILKDQGMKGTQFS